MLDGETIRGLRERKNIFFPYNAVSHIIYTIDKKVRYTLVTRTHGDSRAFVTVHQGSTCSKKVCYVLLAPQRGMERKSIIVEYYSKGSEEREAEVNHVSWATTSHTMTNELAHQRLI